MLTKLMCLNIGMIAIALSSCSGSTSEEVVFHDGNTGISKITAMSYQGVNVFYLQNGYVALDCWNNGLKTYDWVAYSTHTVSTRHDIVSGPTQQTIICARPSK